ALARSACPERSAAGARSGRGWLADPPAAGRAPPAWPGPRPRSPAVCRPASRRDRAAAPSLGSLDLDRGHLPLPVFLRHGDPGLALLRVGADLELGFLEGHALDVLAIAPGGELREPD